MLSDEEQRRFEHITQNVKLDIDGESEVESHSKAREYIIISLVLILGLVGIIASVYFRSIPTGIVGFICLLTAAYRISLTVFSGNYFFEK